MTRRFLIGWMKAAPLAAVLLVVGVERSLADESDFAAGAKSFVQSMTEEAVNSLAGSDIGQDVRRKRFRELMHRKFAFEGIAKWVMGRYWRRASKDERAEYLTLYEDLMVITYADRFEKYAGEKIEIVKSEVRAEKDALVHSKLIRGGNIEPVDVIWRVRKSGDAYKIVDVMVEGLSMGLTQQKEFTSVIRKNGGKVSSLIDELRKRLESNT